MKSRTKKIMVIVGAVAVAALAAPLIVMALLIGFFIFVRVPGANDVQAAEFMKAYTSLQEFSFTVEDHVYRVTITGSASGRGHVRYPDSFFTSFHISRVSSGADLSQPEVSLGPDGYLALRRDSRQWIAIPFPVDQVTYDSIPDAFCMYEVSTFGTNRLFVRASEEVVETTAFNQAAVYPTVVHGTNSLRKNRDLMVRLADRDANYIIQNIEDSIQ